MTDQAVTVPARAIELEAFVERVTAQARASGSIGTAVDRAVEELSVEFDPKWPDTEKLAWLFVANLASLPAAPRRNALRCVCDAVGAASAAQS